MLLLRSLIWRREVQLNLLVGEEMPAPPRQQRSQKKREALLQAGLDLFRKKGFEATTIDEIARKAGVATGGFYQHFATKTQLLLVLMQNLVDALAGVNLQFSTGSSPQEKLREFLEQAFAKDLPYAGALRAWEEAVSSDEHLRRKQLRIRKWTTARVSAVIERLLQLPGARRDVDVPALAHLMDRLFWQLLAEAARLPRAETTRLVRASAHLLAHSLFTGK